jgi:hypothetical protein
MKMQMHNVCISIWEKDVLPQKQLYSIEEDVKDKSWQGVITGKQDID